MEKAAPPVSLRVYAVLAFGCFAAHAGAHTLHGHPAQLLWACTVGTLLLAIGLWLAWARLVAIAVCWLSLGNPSWIFDLWSGDAFMATSVLTHVGGMLFGCLGLHRLGFPRGTWWRAVLCGEALRLSCRLLTSRAENVNVAWDMFPGFEKYFPSYAWYWVGLMVLLAGTFVPTELFFRYVLRWREPAAERKKR